MRKVKIIVVEEDEELFENEINAFIEDKENVSISITSTTRLTLIYYTACISYSEESNDTQATYETLEKQVCERFAGHLTVNNIVDSFIQFYDAQSNAEITDCVLLINEQARAYKELGKYKNKSESPSIGEPSYMDILATLTSTKPVFAIHEPAKFDPKAFLEMVENIKGGYRKPVQKAKEK